MVNILSKITLKSEEKSLIYNYIYIYILYLYIQNTVLTTTQDGRKGNRTGGHHYYHLPPEPSAAEGLYLVVFIVIVR